jgi:hypothetical protein
MTAGPGQNASRCRGDQLTTGRSIGGLYRIVTFKIVITVACLAYYRLRPPMPSTEK